jgi:hypothetical protein
VIAAACCDEMFQVLWTPAAAVARAGLSAAACTSCDKRRLARVIESCLQSATHMQTVQQEGQTCATAEWDGSLGLSHVSSDLGGQAKVKCGLLLAPNMHTSGSRSAAPPQLAGCVQPTHNFPDCTAWSAAVSCGGLLSSCRASAQSRPLCTAESACVCPR